MKIVSTAEAVSIIKSGDRVFLQGAAMTPNTLIDALCERYRELKDVEIVSIHTEGDAKYAREPYNQTFRMNSCFVGANVRNVVNSTEGGIIHIKNIDCAVEIDAPIHLHNITPISGIEEQIGKQVAGLIEDGATLQMGIGNIPNAVLNNLGNHKRLGIHTEMFSDGELPLIEKGVVTGGDKEIKTGKIVTCFAVGSQKLYDFCG